MPKNPFPAAEDEFTPKIKKRLQKFLDNADKAVSEKGRYIWYTDEFKVIGRSNYPQSAEAAAMQYLEDADGNWKGRWVMKVTFRVWKKWQDIFDEDRGPIEIQAIRYKVQGYPNDTKKYSTCDGKTCSLIRLFYHPDEAHLFKLNHLRKMAKAVHSGKYPIKIVTTYNAKDFNFLK